MISSVTMVGDESVSSPPGVSTLNEKGNSEETNPYAYLNREEFSSERFKIEVKNLPKFYGINEFKKFINEKLKLGSSKVKIPRRNSPYIFVCFRSEEDRENAIKIINKFKWKGKELSAYKAKPAPDPLVKRRRDDQTSESVSKKLKTDGDGETQEGRLKASVIPLWNVPYEEQLQQKQETIRQLLLKLGNNLHHQNSSLRDWIKKQKENNNGLICEMYNVRHASTIEGYRNKCEFTVGIDEETSLPTVGFRIGSYATGVTGVAPLDNLNHIPESMKKAAKVFQEFVRSSKLKVFNPELQTGNFRQLTVRCAADHLMLVVGIHPQDLSGEEIEQLKKDLVNFFSEGPGKELKVTSLYYEAIVKKKSQDDVSLPQHLYGDTHIYENILGLNFRISPQAFFQINTLGAEVLYKSAIEIANSQKDTTVVDVCCGTGTIGLCFAKTCNQVLGLEVIPQAIIDAKENAKINEIENCEFFTGKAEDILGSVLYRTRNEDIVTVVDPPRAGLHQKAILQLRKTKKIKKIVYISCNPAAAMKNFVDLGRPASKTIQGDPFVPVKAIPVDMFPFTRHCELIIYFKRLQDNVPQGSSNGNLKLKMKDEKLEIKEQVKITEEKMNIKEEKLDIKEEKLEIKEKSEEQICLSSEENV